MSGNCNSLDFIRPYDSWKILLSCVFYEPIFMNKIWNKEWCDYFPPWTMLIRSLLVETLRLFVALALQFTGEHLLWIANQILWSSGMLILQTNIHMRVIHSCLYQDNKESSVSLAEKQEVVDSKRVPERTNQEREGELSKMISWWRSMDAGEM